MKPLPLHFKKKIYKSLQHMKPGRLVLAFGGVCAGITALFIFDGDKSSGPASAVRQEDGQLRDDIAGLRKAYREYATAKVVADLMREDGVEPPPGLDIKTFSAGAGQLKTAYDAALERAGVDMMLSRYLSPYQINAFVKQTADIAGRLPADFPARGQLAIHDCQARVLSKPGAGHDLQSAKAVAACADSKDGWMVMEGAMMMGTLLMACGFLSFWRVRLEDEIPAEEQRAKEAAAAAVIAQTAQIEHAMTSGGLDKDITVKPIRLAPRA